MDDQANKQKWDITYWYSKPDLRNKLMNFIRKYNVPDEDAKDIFQESYIILDKNMRNNKFRGDSSIEAYLFAIAKFLSFAFIRKDKKTSTLEEVHLIHEYEQISNEFDIEMDYFNKERKKILGEITAKLKEPCTTILEMWQKSYKMSEIAEAVGLSGPDMAKKKRYQCHQNLIALINELPHLKYILKQL